MKRLVIAAALLSIAGGAAASAQPRPYGDRDRDGVPNAYDRHPDRPDVGRPYGDRDRDGVPNAYDRHPYRPDVGRPYGDRDRDGIPNAYDRRDNRFSYGGRYYERYRGPGYVHPPGFAHRSWGRGQYLPPAYFAAPYYVDWRAYHLRPPPRGYRWVRVGNDVVLAAVAGGLIGEVVSGVFY